LVSLAHALRRCLVKHPSKCASARVRLQHAGLALQAADGRLGHTARNSADKARTAATTATPALAVSGQELRWHRVGNITGYVVAREVPGQAPQAEVLDATSVTPPAVPGATVAYTVRTAINGSAWAPVVHIAYPTSTASGTSQRQGAPTLTVSGDSLSWTSVAGAETYVLVTRVPGAADQYSVVGGTSTTPPAVPGKTVSYSVRTAVDGSAWALAVTIAYPSATTPAPVGESIPAGPFIKGVNNNFGGWGAQAVPTLVSEMQQLGVNWDRMDLSWAEVEPERGVFHWSGFEQTVASAKANGITILPIVGYAPTWTSPDNASAYAEFVAAAVARFGPGTSANLQWWELWNEPYFAYAWSNQTPDAGAYARDALAAAQAAKAVAPSVKLLLAADDQNAGQTGGSTPWDTSWVADMFTAVPSLGDWVDAISVHPYGDNPETPVAETGGWSDSSGNWAFQRIDSIRAQFLSHGVNLPFWITEEGWSTWDISEAAQAANFTALTKEVAARPWVRALFPYCLREFESAPTSDQSGFGLLKYGTWQPKAAFFALQQGLQTLN
jgi:hypothetical protein